MTKRHQRYLTQYPARIHRKRLKRRRMLKGRHAASRVTTDYFRRVLREYMATRPARQAVRSGSKKWHDPISRLFRKPTV